MSLLAWFAFSEASVAAGNNRTRLVLHWLGRLDWRGGNRRRRFGWMFQGGDSAFQVLKACGEPS